MVLQARARMRAYPRSAVGQNGRTRDVNPSAPRMRRKSGRPRSCNVDRAAPARTSMAAAAAAGGILRGAAAGPTTGENAPMASRVDRAPLLDGLAHQRVDARRPSNGAMRTGSE